MSNAYQIVTDHVINLVISLPSSSPLVVSDENSALRSAISGRKERSKVLLPIHLEPYADEWRTDVVE